VTYEVRPGTFPRLWRERRLSDAAAHSCEACGRYATTWAEIELEQGRRVTRFLCDGHIVLARRRKWAELDRAIDKKVEGNQVKADEFHCEWCGGSDDRPRQHTMDCSRPFKVMRMRGPEFPEDQVESVPWWLVLQGPEGRRDNGRRALKNHGQTLERLNERGGLSPLELYAVANDMSFRDAMHGTGEMKAMQWLRELRDRGELE
jgi:hypothetical protein